jgi:hypothetical protein
VENDGIEHASFRVVVDDVTFQFEPAHGTTKNLTAQVTVLTSAYYQMNTRFLDPEDSESEKDQEKAEITVTLEGELKPEQEKKKQRPKEDWGSDTSRSVKTYDFAYESGRWVLKTTDLEEGVKLAFEVALKSQ